jgi:hypothetical protein
MRLTFDFDDLPTEEEVGIVINTVKAAKVATDPHKVHLSVNGRGLSFSIGAGTVESTEEIGIDVVKEVVTALVTELKLEIALENGAKFVD